MKEVRKPEYPEKTPDDELQKMPHANSRKSKLKCHMLTPVNPS